MTEQSETTDLYKLKKQYINNVEDLGEDILIKTTNFEFIVSKNKIKQIKQFEVYPKILENNTFHFDNYQIKDRIIQKSAKIKDFNAFIYFQKINYSFANEIFLRKYDFLKSKSNNIFEYHEINKNDIGIRDFFVYLVLKISALESIDYDLLNNMCREYTETTYSRATFKPKDIYKMYNVKEINGGYIFIDNAKNQTFDLKLGKNF